ncbi:hypothetical protein C8J57DRAFT_1321561 [Mycena rebaudengoi]|nr:hypothetical protein C8J57DRAFT_1321561 [Mycena rebaudengoi]
MPRRNSPREGRARPLPRHGRVQRTESRRRISRGYLRASMAPRRRAHDERSGVSSRPRREAAPRSGASPLREDQSPAAVHRTLLQTRAGNASTHAAHAAVLLLSFRGRWGMSAAWHTLRMEVVVLWTVPRTCKQGSRAVRAPADLGCRWWARAGTGVGDGETAAACAADAGGGACHTRAARQDLGGAPLKMVPAHGEATCASCSWCVLGAGFERRVGTALRMARMRARR